MPASNETSDVSHVADLVWLFKHDEWNFCNLLCVKLLCWSCDFLSVKPVHWSLLLTLFYSVCGSCMTVLQLCDLLLHWSLLLTLCNVSVPELHDSIGVV